MLKPKKRLEEMALILNPDLDQVAVAKEDIPSGSILEFKDSIIETKDFIRKGERLALVDIPEGELLRQYGYSFAQSKKIFKGELISRSKIKDSSIDIGLENFKEPAKTQFMQKYKSKTFLGYRRKNAQVGTRNYYLVVPASMCISEIANEVSTQLDKNAEILKQYPNIDGIVSIPHTEGCGCDSGLQIERLLRVLRSYVRHPNVGGCLIMDLGCEQTNYEKMCAYLKDTLEEGLKPIDWITLQESGGSLSTIEKAKKIIKNRLPQVNQIRRESCQIEKLVLGTECGASDSFSGITANPVIGNVADKIIFGGGCAILSEIPEMVGTFQMLLPRFRSQEVAYKFKEALDWYINFAKKLGLNLNDNLVPKNIEGGLINNCIKSLGAVMKGGQTAIEDVIDYGQPISKRGLNIMQGPGGDPESVTGIVASGATVICFSTGFGAITGNAICPVIKVTSNNTIFEKMSQDMDFNAGRLMSSSSTIDALGNELLDFVIEIASGRKTCSERLKQRQFQIWTAGKLPL